jgi:hypothetical protein
MSVRIRSSFLKSIDKLAKDERPIIGVHILPKLVDDASRRSFHLALLLDVSGSMEGDRIHAVKTTLGLLLEALSDDDILTIISYASAANVMANAVTINAETRTSLRTSINNIEAEGGTNLESALIALRGVSQSTNKVDAAFILTDGHINKGIVASSGLTRLLSAAILVGTPVFTLGFGTDHNSRMLRDIALRTRGSYTYADAAELIPATIADIISGLATEVGRNSRLILPTGWRCLEITADPDAKEFIVGTLVSEKKQWVVLEGPTCLSASSEPITFIWQSADGIEHTETCTPNNEFDPLEIEEQFCRCRVAAVQTEVQDILESGNIEDAKTALIELGAELDTSPAKDRTFVISLRAQVDEMIDALDVSHAMPFMHRGMISRGPMTNMVSGSSMLALGPILSRMASNTTALGGQRGIVSHIRSTSIPPTTVAGRPILSGVTHTFSSPNQRRATHTMQERFTQTLTNNTNP